ncbi:unnamed protein product [Zymoseptoria tritici ST99CH_1A5]|uniref:Peptidase M14 domain-containing protein n=1 Tax=Zymoseptoria tritici ST99CH_1A5 TaxID=1276529 RepID=A0A1Y6LKX2_ZYMTR|nr:unnamed protein product [Zymoseptoria tritici ST99CH_1A5]
MFTFRLLPFVALALASVLPREQAVTYDGYKVYHIDTDGDADAVLTALSALPFEQWNFENSKHLDISVPGSDVAAFEALGLNYSVMHENLGLDIAVEKDFGDYESVSRRQSGSLPATSWFNSYHSYAQHVQYWKDLNAAFPSNSQPFVAGKSYEGRDIFGLKLFGKASSTPKQAIIWHGTVHAREWITTMTVEYLAYNIINGYKTGDAEYVSILDKYDFYIMPVVNPDGFVYTQTNDRLWRKNRSPTKVLNLPTCYGTDVNRNWPYQWTGDPNGASTNPCAQTYKGKAAGDSPENKALVSQMTGVSAKQPIALYLDFHSYGNYLLSPYGYTASVPANSASQVSLAQKAGAAIKAVYGTEYTVGPSGATLYPTTGSSADFATDIAKAKYAYAIELRDKGQNGFVLPPDQIVPTGQEVLAGVKVLLKGL